MPSPKSWICFVEYWTLGPLRLTSVICELALADAGINMHGSLAYRCFSFMNPPPSWNIYRVVFKGISKALLLATTRACPDQINYPYSRVLSGCLTRAGLVTRPWSELTHSVVFTSLLSASFLKVVYPVSNLRA